MVAFSKKISRTSSSCLGTCLGNSELEAKIGFLFLFLFQSSCSVEIMKSFLSSFILLRGVRIITLSTFVAISNGEIESPARWVLGAQSLVICKNLGKRFNLWITWKMKWVKQMISTATSRFNIL